MASPGFKSNPAPQAPNRDTYDPKRNKDIWKFYVLVKILPWFSAVLSFNRMPFWFDIAVRTWMMQHHRTALRIRVARPCIKLSPSVRGMYYIITS